jgi:4-alpha-glucanotransferase
MTVLGKRAAGILMHITSLPSTYGIGDLGPEAFAFADFLNRTHQRYWQLLPLSPVHQQQGYSPYSSVSSMAGNPLLISPYALAQDGLIKMEDLLSEQIVASGKVNYQEAALLKERIFEKAFVNFQRQKQQAFDDFIHREAYWLDDFSLYMALKKEFQDKPWYGWPDDFKNRKLASLMAFTSQHQEEIHYIKWCQFIFFRQWKTLKLYANKLNIRMLGDLPFYISYDSADVWSRTEIFKLDKKGGMAGIAGVPPDYFNEDGQLWGMPVFKWDVLKEQRYDWWVKRIRKNLELFDVLRLDHFRAFADYWEVPAGEKTAVNGKWVKGPGSQLFIVLQQEFGDLPFVAEDLGDISKEVYQLRDQFRFPGMKVLQFAFGKTMPSSDHIPHNFTKNFIVYTGTHDNNTTRGWYSNEIKAPEKKQLNTYTGLEVTEKNIHEVLSRMAYASVARTAILPMQDLLGLEGSARMNTPASTTENWLWSMQKNAVTPEVEDRLVQWATLYRRK